MSAIELEALHRLSVSDKLTIIYDLWDDIAKENNERDIPSVHQVIITSRLEKINQGKATFTSWEEVKGKYIK
jgi:hypothetical protein